jgi:predicted RNA-binding protein (virulence factor B family)
MQSDIGLVAGDIWRYLVENDDSSTIKIRVNLGISNTTLYLALGWLLREGKINIALTDYSYKISLK